MSLYRIAGSAAAAEPTRYERGADRPRRGLAA